MISPITIRSNWNLVPNNPIVYVWWFDQIPQILSTHIPGVRNLVQKTTVCGKTYYALYVGIAKHGRDRMKWHIYPSVAHTINNVNNGRISTLRQTISALLNINQTASQQAVNDYMDQHCLVEWIIMPSKKEAELYETQQLCQNTFPLNISKNKSNQLHAWIQCLTQLRKLYRK